MGIKGHPDVNRNIDTDVIVAEVRETSRKPDEVSYLTSIVFVIWLFPSQLQIWYTVLNSSFNSYLLVSWSIYACLHWVHESYQWIVT